MVFSTHAHGKLLLTGEYVVLDNAHALALPVRYGQGLVVTTKSPSVPAELHWISRDETNAIWLEVVIDLPDLRIKSTTDQGAAERLLTLLRACQQLNSGFLSASESLLAETTIDFPRAWGLGTSSTLVAAVAQWAQVDPYTILEASFGGSGYDIACAYANGPIVYQRRSNPRAQAVSFAPAFAEHLYFVYLGRKQDSREGIRTYRERAGELDHLVVEISDITYSILEATTLDEFERLLTEHEEIISNALDLPLAKDLYFYDWQGKIKSLGAWGGDFVLATSRISPEATRAYFAGKGYPVCIAYAEMIFY